MESLCCVTSRGNTTQVNIPENAGRSDGGVWRNQDEDLLAATSLRRLIRRRAFCRGVRTLEEFSRPGSHLSGGPHSPLGHPSHAANICDHPASAGQISKLPNPYCI